MEAPDWNTFYSWVNETHQCIYLTRPEFLTIRALKSPGDVRDYVMCRKDGAYSDARHPDSVEIGSIQDDLSRRDFTCNALARNIETGELLDPFGGARDIRDKLLCCVGWVADRFAEDPLRILRAIRFHITKDLHLSAGISHHLDCNIWAEPLSKISRDRVREELERCFKANSPRTIHTLHSKLHPDNLQALLGNDIWLMPTTRER